MEEPSAASRLAVEAFLCGVSPIVGRIGLSGETWRRPSGSKCIEEETMNTLANWNHA